MRIRDDAPVRSITDVGPGDYVQAHGRWWPIVSNTAYGLFRVPRTWTVSVEGGRLFGMYEVNRYARATDLDTIDVAPPTIALAGDPRRQDATWTLLPPNVADGSCSQCAVQHEPDAPHDQQSLHYQYSFFAEHARWPTWADAMAHCTGDVRQMWIDRLRAYGVEVDESTGG